MSVLRAGVYLAILFLGLAAQLGIAMNIPNRNAQFTSGQNYRTDVTRNRAPQGQQRDVSTGAFHDAFSLSLNPQKSKYTRSEFNNAIMKMKDAITDSKINRKVALELGHSADALTWRNADKKYMNEYLERRGVLDQDSRVYIIRALFDFYERIKNESEDKWLETLFEVAG